MINVIIIVLGFILLLQLLYYEKKEDRKPLLVVKSALSLLFVVAALLQPHQAPAYYQYLLAGLIFCLIGDVCLALPQEKAFKVGLVAFLVGHVLYIFAFSSLIRIDDWLSPWLLVIFCLSALVFVWLRPHLKSMLIPVLVYILVITVMVSGAWGVFWKSSFQVSGRVLVLLGALCFYFSDVFVARSKFIKDEFRNRLLGLPLYYTAQFLLAFSVGLFLSRA